MRHVVHNCEAPGGQPVFIVGRVQYDVLDFL
jgi:hypothetical protein